MRPGFRGTGRTRVEPMPTLAEHLESDTVALDDLHGTYGPMLHIVRELIGVVPDCDTYLEIWPAGFRTYNLCVPNFLNLPASVVSRGDLKAHMGLAMYTSSRAAECPYCAAHTCSYALRRGASEGAVDGSNRTELEQAVVTLAESMASEPSTWDRSIVDELGQHLSADDIEWIAMSVGMMGFLNKFMDAISVPLEVEAINDVAELIEPTGWGVGRSGWRNGTMERATSKVPVDSAGLYARMIRQGPKATLIERGWTKHLPSSAPDLRRYLREHRNVDVPVLSRMRHAKPMRGLAAMFDQNLDPTTSSVGLGDKALAGLVYASMVGDASLIDVGRSAASAHGVAPTAIDAAIAAGADAAFPLRSDAELADPGFRSPHAEPGHTLAVIKLAHAIAPSPAVTTDELAAATAEALSSAEVIEVAVWISVLQLVHRITRFYS